MQKRPFFIVTTTIVIVTFWITYSWGLTIIEPRQGAVCHPGDEVVVRVQASPGENIQEIYFASMKMKKFATIKHAPYEFRYTIDSFYSGTDNIIVDAMLSDGSHIDLEVQISVPLPSNITLKTISVEPAFVDIYKLPKGSDLNKIRIYETKKLYVSGMYSDGIKREIASDSITYRSNDEKVATVTSEGKVIAQGIGKTKITIISNGFKKEVDVEVEAATP